MNLKAEELRRRHPRFVYASYSAEPRRRRLELSFRFRLEPGIVFTPTIAIESIGGSRVESVSAAVLERLAFHLG
jgi:hypothetical protein